MNPLSSLLVRNDFVSMSMVINFLEASLALTSLTWQVSVQCTWMLCHPKCESQYPLSCQTLGPRVVTVLSANK